jgi:hypothetical protein
VTPVIFSPVKIDGFIIEEIVAGLRVYILRPPSFKHKALCPIGLKNSILSCVKEDFEPLEC